MASFKKELMHNELYRSDVKMQVHSVINNKVTVSVIASIELGDLISEDLLVEHNYGSIKKYLLWKSKDSTTTYMKSYFIKCLNLLKYSRSSTPQSNVILTNIVKVPCGYSFTFKFLSAEYAKIFSSRLESNLN